MSDSLLGALDAHIDARIAAQLTGGDWVDVATALPIGRRAAYALARAGKIEGARLVARRWLARRAAIDAYVESRVRTRPALRLVEVARSVDDQAADALGLTARARSAR